MRYLAREHKKLTQSAPTMNTSGQWSNWWTDGNGRSVTIVDGESSESVRTVVPNTNWDTSSSTNIIGQFGTLTVGHKYYYRHKITAEDVQEGWFKLAYIGVTGYITSSSNESIITPTITTGNYTVYTAKCGPNVKFHITAEAFDLTADFGAGKEPTDVEFCRNYYGSDYKTEGTHYRYIDYYVMDGRNNEMEVIG